MDTSDLVILVVTIALAAVGGTWVLATHLSSIQVAIGNLVERVKQHDADIIDLKKVRDGKRRK